MLDNDRWTAAFYLVGYTVETGLKACILRFVEETGVIFTDKRFAEKCWTQRIEDLVRQANLEPKRGQDIGANSTLGVGHIDHGKTTLTAALLRVQSEKSLAEYKSYQRIAKGGIVRDKNKTVTILASHVRYETECRDYAHTRRSSSSARRM